MLQKLLAQKKSTVSLLIKLYLPTIIFMFLVLFLSFKTGVPLKNFTTDPTAIARMNPFMGVVSNIGILFWCAATSICFFSFILLKKTQLSKIKLNFFLFSGYVTLILLLDDLFLFHEKNFSSREVLFSNLSFLSQELVYLIYFIIVLLYLIKFGRIILKTNFIILLMAFLFFTISISIDFFNLSVFDNTLVEDGSKLLGIISWFGYFSSVCFETIKATPLGDRF